jgi:3-oxoacyl-[acyl-carrier protein] reductase
MIESKSRIALVTGASSGIGRSVALRFAKNYAGVVVHARSSRDRLEAVAGELAALDVDCEIVLGDLAKAGTGSKIIEAASARFGRLDALVANAGFPTPKAWHDATMNDIEYALRGNLMSFFELTKAAHSMLVRACSPRIVAVGSFTSFLFRNDLEQYPISAASKGGLVTATKSMAAAFAADGITVNCVVPGYINRERRPGHKANANPYEEIEARIPLGRMGRSDEVAAMIEFLASEDASYITGQAIHVNGGIV